MIYALLVVHVLGAILSVSCTSRLLFGPDYPNRFACLHDVYGIAATNFKIPPYLSEKLVNAPIEVSRVVESYQDIGVERELSESAYRLYEESKNLNTGLVYPSTINDFRIHIARDYVASQVALTSLNTLKAMSYATRALPAFSKLSAKFSKDMSKEEHKFGICTAIVYLKVAEKLERQRNKQFNRIKEETKRIVTNLNILPSAKAAGDVYLLKAHSYVANINTVLIIFTVTFISYFS